MKRYHVATPDGVVYQVVAVSRYEALHALRKDFGSITLVILAEEPVQISFEAIGIGSFV